MKDKVHNRELFVLDVLGARLQGTYHWAAFANLAERSGPLGRSGIGVLILNGLSAVRSGKGDSAVYWADAIAERGYHTFRLDLPGYGESSGELPSDQLGFINGGGFGPIVSAAMDNLAMRFKLSGVVLVAHCSGTVSAIYTAAINRKCKGIVLMDPYFHLPQSKAPRLRRILHSWALQTGLERGLISAYGWWKRLSRRLRGDALPENANLSLLQSWKRVAASGIPILILKRAERAASASKPQGGEFDYLVHILRLPGQKGQMIARRVDGVHHSFANRQGRETIRQHIVQWLEDLFEVPCDGDFEPCMAVSGAVSNSLTVETLSGD